MQPNASLKQACLSARFYLVSWKCEDLIYLLMFFLQEPTYPLRDKQTPLYPVFVSRRTEVWQRGLTVKYRHLTNWFGGAPKSSRLYTDDTEIVCVCLVFSGLRAQCRSPSCRTWWTGARWPAAEGGSSVPSSSTTARYEPQHSFDWTGPSVCTNLWTRIWINEAVLFHLCEMKRLVRMMKSWKGLSCWILLDVGMWLL